MIVFKGEGKPPLEVAASAECFYRSWKEACGRSNNHEEVLDTIANNNLLWIASLEGVIKINVDAAEFKDYSKGGLGVIAKAKEGGCKVCKSLPIWFLNKIALTEAQAVLEG